jgi:hypothetical protein
MSDYSHKLKALEAKKQKLLDEETKLLDKRKKEIGVMAERCGVLVVPDTVLAGILLEVKEAVAAKDNRLKEWEANGARFLQVRRQHGEAVASNPN